MSKRNIASEKSQTINKKKSEKLDKIKQLLQLGQIIDREKEEAEELENIKSLIFDSAIVIGFVTTILYLFTYIYLDSFYGYYGINDINIPVSLDILVKIISELFFANLKTILIAIVETMALISIFNYIQANLTIKEVGSIIFNALYISTVSCLTSNINEGLLKYIHTISSFVGVYLFIPLVALVILLRRYFHETRILPRVIKATHFFVIFSLIGLLAYGVQEYAFCKAYIKSDYLYDEASNLVLIYQDDQKSIFIPCTPKLEKKYIWKNNDELSGIKLSHYKGRITFSD